MRGGGRRRAAGGFRTCHLFMAAAAAFVLLGLTFSSSSVGGGGGKIGGLLEPFKEGNTEMEEKREKIMKLVDKNIDNLPDPKELENMLGMVKGVLNNKN